MIFQIIIICYYIFLIPQIFLRYILEYLNLMLYKVNELFVNYMKIKNIYEKDFIYTIYEDNTSNPIIANIKGILIIIFQIIIIFYYIFLIPQIILRYILEPLNLMLYKVNEFFVNFLKIKNIYDKGLVITINEDKILNPIIANIKGILIMIFQIIIICYCIFLIPQIFIRFILEYLNLILCKINDVLIYTFMLKKIYEKNLITDVYEDKTLNPIITNIKGILIIIFQIIIISYCIFLIPQIFLRYILEHLNLILYKINDILVNTFIFKKIYEKNLITNIYEDKTLNPIIANIKGILIMIFQIIIISYYIFLIPQIFLRFILEYLNLYLYKVFDLLVNSFKMKIIYKKTFVTSIYEDKTINPIIINIEGILIIIFQIIIISYCIFLIPQIFLRFILEYLNLALYKLYDLLVYSFKMKIIYKKDLIINIYEDKTNNPIIANIKGIFIMIFQIIIISFCFLLIPQLLLRFIFEYLNFGLYLLYEKLVSTFIFKKIYEKNLITNIYEDKTSNPIITNIKGILIMIFQIIIISYYIFLIPQIFIRFILEYLNLALYNIYDFLVNIFITPKFYAKTLISNIYEDKIENPILTNIKGIFIVPFQIIIISYILLIIPQIVLIKCLSCNFNTQSSDISLDDRIKSYSIFMAIIQVVIGFIYFTIIYIICIIPSLYYIFIDLNLRSKEHLNATIKNLSNIIYYSNLLEFTQIFLGKYYLNIILYFSNKLLIKHSIMFLSKTTDILFVKILNDIFSEFYSNPFIPVYLPLKYFIKYIGITFICISKKIKNISKSLDIILNVFALIICIIPFYLIYACFENDSKKNHIFRNTNFYLSCVQYVEMWKSNMGN